MMVHLGTEDQRQQIAVVSVLLDASSIRDYENLNPFLHKWTQEKERVERNCERRRMLQDQDFMNYTFYNSTLHNFTKESEDEYVGPE